MPERRLRLLARLVVVVLLGLIVWVGVRLVNRRQTVAHYAGRDYIISSSCGRIPPRSQRRRLSSSPSGQGTAYRVRTPSPTPIEIFVFDGRQCTGVYSLEGGP